MSDFQTENAKEIRLETIQDGCKALREIEEFGELFDARLDRITAATRAAGLIPVDVADEVDAVIESAKARLDRYFGNEQLAN